MEKFNINDIVWVVTSNRVKLAKIKDVPRDFPQDIARKSYSVKLLDVHGKEEIMRRAVRGENIFKNKILALEYLIEDAKSIVEVSKGELISLALNLTVNDPQETLKERINKT